MESCPHDAAPSLLAEYPALGASVTRVGTAPTTLWTWLRCHERALPDAAAIFPRRETWRTPPLHELCCAPPRDRCFRGVLDGRIEMPAQDFARGEKVKVRNYAANVGVASHTTWTLGRVTNVGPPLRVRGASSSSGSGLVWDEVRSRDDPSDDSFDAALVESVRRVLVAEAGLRDDRVKALTWRRQTVKPLAGFDARNAYHSDYFQQGAAFSAILYTGDAAEEELVGGWTAFVDASEPTEEGGAWDVGLERLANGSGVLHRGWAVAPVVGRLVLFSGGSENWHAPLPVGAGRRQSLQMFFKCLCELNE